MKDLIKELAKAKKGEGKIDPTYKSAKMGVLKDIHKMASDELGEDLKGMKKVTVAASDKEGLEEGLEKAKDIVDHSEEACAECEKAPCECEHSEESSELTPEEEEVLAKLLAKKSKKAE